MPTFCRHNRLLLNCPICTREQAIEGRPLVSSTAPRSAPAAAPAPGSGASGPPSRRTKPGAGGGGVAGRRGVGVRVRRLVREGEDGYSCALVPGLRSSGEADRLAQELAFAATRLELIARDPPGLLAEVAAGEDLEERTWLAFQIAVFCPLEEADPFRAIRASRTAWGAGEPPRPEPASLGPRAGSLPDGGLRTVHAYRAWAQRAGSQAAAFTGDPSWSAERRFARLLERLALPGLHRDARYELLVLLAHLGLYELRAETLSLGGDNEVTLAAKRALGIGDPLLLERRARALADAAEIPLEALDLGFANWERGTRMTLGAGPGSEPDPRRSKQVCDALELA